MPGRAPRLFKVFGYASCPYFNLAREALKSGGSASARNWPGLNASTDTVFQTRAEYKQWLARGEGLAAAVPPFHTTCPAVFDDDDNFVGGYDELRENLRELSDDTTRASCIIS